MDLCQHRGGQRGGANGNRGSRASTSAAGLVNGKKSPAPQMGQRFSDIRATRPALLPPAKSVVFARGALPAAQARQSDRGVEDRRDRPILQRRDQAAAVAPTSPSSFFNSPLRYIS